MVIYSFVQFKKIWIDEFHSVCAPPNVTPATIKMKEWKKVKETVREKGTKEDRKREKGSKEDRKREKGRSKERRLKKGKWKRQNGAGGRTKGWGKPKFWTHKRMNDWRGN